MQITNKVIRRFENSILKELKALLVMGGRKMNDVQPGMRADGLLAGSEAAKQRMQEYAAKNLNLEDGSECDIPHCEDDE